MAALGNFVGRLRIGRQSALNCLSLFGQKQANGIKAKVSRKRSFAEGL
jgi:hypothetical protein